MRLPSSMKQLELRGMTSDPDDRNLMNLDSFSELEENAQSLTSQLLDAVCDSEYPEN